MFTGIIEELCFVKNIERSGKLARLTVGCSKIIEDSKTGGSISINGACLTIVERSKDSLVFEVMPETSKVSNIGQVQPGDKVNAERALKIGERLGGHFVTGHVDCIGSIRKKYYLNNNLCFDIAVPTEFMKYVILKGSIAVDGISLTIAGKKSNLFSVYVIPHTLENTTLGSKGPSDKVNIEFDILAKKG